MKKLLLVAVLAILGALGCGSANLPYLTAIAVNPASPSVAAGQTQQFTAQGTFSDSTTRDLTNLVTWTSSTAPVGTINSAGLAQTYTQGTSTVSASFTIPSGTVTGTTTLTVTPPALVSIAVRDTSTIVPGPTSLASATIAQGTSHQFLAYGIYSDGGERNITGSVTWTSTPLAAATINNAGRAAGIAAGTATITATDPTTSIAGSSSLVVTNATLASVVVYPVGQANPALLGQTIAPLTRLPFSALGQFSDGTTQDVTADANWTSSNTAVASVTNTVPSGVATGLTTGATQIQAAVGTTTGTANLIVSAATLTSIALTPDTAGVAIGSTLPLNAVGTFSDGSTQRINLAVAWTVTPNDGSLATVDQTGVVTGVAAGAATVTAKFGTVTKDAAINVQNLSSIAVTPTPVTIAQGTATQFVATATLADGTTQDVSASVTWISMTPAITTISDALGTAGWATGNSPGTANIGAVFSGQSSLPSLTVTNATLATLAITPTAPADIALGTSQQYQATGTFSDSTTQDLSYQVTWTSSLPAVAVVNGAGLATSTGIGTTTVKAAGNINGNPATSQVDLTVH